MGSSGNASEEWQELAREAEHQLIELTRTIRDLNLGTPGVHGPNRGPSLNQLPQSTKRRVQQVIAANRYATPAVFGQLLMNLSGPPEQILQWLNDYTREYVNWHFYNCIALLHRALTRGQQWQYSWFDFEADSYTKIRARGFSVAPLDEVEDRERDAHLPHLLSAQRQMLAGRSVGWVVDIRAGMQVTAPSWPMCELLGIPYARLAGSYLVEDPLRSRLQELLVNFAEWVLVLGMLVRSQGAESERNARFFEWLARYADKHYAAIVCQLAEVPDHLHDRGGTRADLRQCLDAALGRACWPPYNFMAWNRWRLHVGRHPLLAAGDTARFVQVVLPIPHGERPAGFETTLYEEHADEVANCLLRRLLQRTGTR